MYDRELNTYELIYDCLKGKKYSEQKKILDEFLESYDTDSPASRLLYKCTKNVVEVYEMYRDKDIDLPPLYELEMFNAFHPEVPKYNITL